MPAHRTCSILALLVALPAGVLAAEGGKERTAYIRSHYTKTEVRIPMRDGARLFTAVYRPNDRSKVYPILLQRTPYGLDPYGADRYHHKLGPTAQAEKDGYVFVIQDVRGRFMSEGSFVHMRPNDAAERGGKAVDESTDTWDTIEWLTKRLQGHNGKVGMWGISYGGFYSTCSLVGAHRALKAVSPQAPIADWYWDDVHHHGTYVLPLTFFLHAMGQRREGLITEWPEPFDFETTDGYRFYMELGSLKNVNERFFKGEIAFWNEVVQHPDYDDFWKARSILPRLGQTTPAVLVIGGWYDSEDLFGPLKTYQTLERHNSDTYNGLVMGPWIHGGWTRSKGDRVADVDFGWETSAPFMAEVVMPFFEHHLRCGPDPKLPEATMFETGANRWRRFGAWPPKGLVRRRLHLREETGLAFEPPAAGGEDAHDAYVSDPAKPVPYSARVTPYWSKTFLAEDQRFAGWRTDVLAYESEPLEDDVTLAGPLNANLWVSTTGRDADFVVKLIDVWPGKLPGKPKSAAPWRDPPDRGGQQAMVRAEAMRGRYREGYDSPRPFEPGQVTAVSFELLDVLHTFKRGHRIMVQIQSSWFPYTDRNPQSWVPNIFEAREEDFVPATHRVYRTPAWPSHLDVGVLPALDGTSAD